MKKLIWSVDTLERTYDMKDSGGLDAVRGIFIGLAISQVFWLAIAHFML